MAPPSSLPPLDPVYYPAAVQPQEITASLARSAIFLIVTVKPGDEAAAAVQEVLANVSGLVRATGFRRPEATMSCVTSIGAHAWGRLFPGPRPRELQPFEAIRGVHVAPSTPGDILFHIRADDRDMCFEFETSLLAQLGGNVTVVDETPGFKFFDDRDLLGFVDGTENPNGAAREAAVVIGDEAPLFKGGSYVITQKYLHDLGKWNAIPVEQQERIVGRQKLSDIELEEAAKPSYAHNVLTNIEENGEPLQILRDNMPFGEIGKGEFGTYFIGYARSPSRIERMLDNMFIGLPPGNYDRLLDVSRAVTGTLFFVPSAAFLDAVTPEPAAAATAPFPDSSLRIGSLKDEAGHE